MLFRNTLAQSSRLIVGQIASVVVAPLLIGRLGLTAFGVWAVTGAAASYVSLLDFGITRSLSRFVALHDARGDRLAIRRVMTVGLVAVALVGAAGIAVALVAEPAVNDLLGRPVSDAVLRTVLLCSASLLALQLIGQVFDALPAGLRRFVPPNTAGVFGIACNFTASIVILLVDPRLTSYAIANAAAAVPAVVASVLSLAYVWRGPLLARPTPALARELVGFGAKTQVSALSALVNFQTDKLVIAAAVGVRASAAYEIGARVALAVRELAVITVSAMIPQATAEIVRRGTAAIRGFYRNWSLRVMAIAVGVFTLAALCSPYVLEAWIGETPARSRGVLVGLSLAFLVWQATGVPSTLAIGAGRPGMPARNAFAVAILNIVLTVILAPLFGVWGVMVGTVVAMTLMTGAFLVQFHRAFEIPAADFRSAVLGPGALGLALALPVGLLVAFVLPIPSDRWPALGLLALVGGGFGLAYWIGATALDYLPERLRFPGVRPRARTAALAPPT
jgi:O-antigen/teichoic acid export membrane protein